MERKNHSLEELARTLLNDSNLPKYFWADAMNTTCYVLNSALIRPILKRPHMSFIREENQTLVILKCLDVDVLF